MFGIGKKKARGASDHNLRDNALAGELPPLPADARGVAILAMMELSAQGGLATVCSFADGTTSLYTSTGGGVIGVGADPRANAASRDFVASVEASRESLTPTDGAPDLGADRVRFLLRIGNQIYGAECSIEAAQRPDHPLHHVWDKGQDVLTWIRVISQERERA